MSYQNPTDADFSRLGHQIGANVELLSKNVHTMQRLVNQPGNRSELFRLQHTSNLLARDTSELLKELIQLPHPTNQSEQRQRRFLRDRLTHDFSESLRNLQVLQRAITSLEHTLQSGADSSSGEQPTHVLIDLAQQNVEGATQTQEQLQAQQQQQSSLNINELREREESVRKLENDIVEVNNIFKSLATMVHEQAETVDSIESSIFRATEEVSQGAQDIVRAREYQDRSRRKKFYLAIIFFVIMAVLLWLVTR